MPLTDNGMTSANFSPKNLCLLNKNCIGQRMPCTNARLNIPSIKSDEHARQRSWALWALDSMRMRRHEMDGPMQPWLNCMAKHAICILNCT